MNKRTSFLYLFVLALAFSSCIKKDVTPLTDEGNTFIKINEAPLKQLFFSPFNDIRKVDLFSLRRDANSSAELQTSNSITLKRDDAMIDNYNNENGTDFELLPDSLYSIANAAYTASGGNFTASFSPGDFAEEFTINLNGAKWDLSKKYAMGFRIMNADGRAITTGKDSVLALISIKNQYDGTYDLTWTNYHPSSNPGYTGGTTVIEMHTVGSNSSKMYWPDAGGYAIPSILGGSPGYFSAQEPAYTVDPVTNKVTVMNTVGSVVYSMAANYDSHYDPATRTFYVRFGYNYDPGGIFNPATNREWTQEFKYTGPR